MKHIKINKLLNKKILILFIIVVSTIFFTSCKYESDDFGKYKEEREAIATAILNEELEIQENGVVTLPEDCSHLADTGEVCMVMFTNESPAVYFWTFRGFAGDSRGYVYVLNSDSTDNISEKCTNSFEFINVVEIEPNWYSVSTQY